MTSNSDETISYIPRDPNSRQCHKRGSSVGPALSILSFNIEGFSSAKANIISATAKEYDLMCLKETHKALTYSRPTIPGQTLVAEIRHKQYGSAVFTRPGLQIEQIHTQSSDTNIECITISLKDIMIMAVYKPPASEFLIPIPPTRCHRTHQIYVGDFNSHSPPWGYGK